MNGKALFVLVHAEARRRALQAVSSAPVGYVVILREATRTLEQNAKLWAMLRDIASQVPWEVDGEIIKIDDEAWKDIFTVALRGHQRVARGLHGGLVSLGLSTSKMNKREFSDLIELIYAFGAEHEVRWSNTWVT
jgi:hypothetical protein